MTSCYRPQPPGMDGLALTRFIRAAEREHGGHLPIIAITGTTQPAALAACRKAGMDDVLPKPIELEDLRRQLDRWLPRAVSHAATDPVPVGTGAGRGGHPDPAYMTRSLGNLNQRICAISSISLPRPRAPNCMPAATCAGKATLAR